MKLGTIIYHTDLILNMGEDYAVVCTEAIEEKYREKVLRSLK
jgi:hypothetical protein